MTQLTSKWLLAASVALLTACSADTTLLGPAQPASEPTAPSVHVREQVQLPPVIERAPSFVDDGEFDDTADAQAERKPAGRFSRYAMAAS